MLTAYDPQGFPRETMAFMVFLSFPFDILLPILISKWARAEGNAPLRAFVFAYPLRIVLTVVGAALVYVFPVRPRACIPHPIPTIPITFARTDGSQRAHNDLLHLRIRRPGLLSRPLTHV